MDRTTWTDKRIDDAFGLLREDISGLRADMRAGLAAVSELGSEIGDVRTELRGETGNVRSELRAEMRAGFADVRSEMRGEFADVRSEMRGEFADVRSEIRDIRGELAQVKVFMLAGLVTILAAFIGLHG